MIAERTFQYGAQIDGRHEVSTIQQVVVVQPRPFVDHATSGEAVTRQKRDAPGSVVGATGATSDAAAAMVHGAYGYGFGHGYGPNDYYGSTKGF